MEGVLLLVLGDVLVHRGQRDAVFPHNFGDLLNRNCPIFVEVRLLENVLSFLPADVRVDHLKELIKLLPP